MVKILDCTLRDGGYYTNWDFNDNLVKLYLNSFNGLPVEYLEIGYRSPKKSEYLGRYFFCTRDTLKFIKSNTKKKLAIILNEKDVRIEHIESLLSECVGIIDLVRIAIDPSNFSRALTLAKSIKKKGFKVAFNVMYLSKWNEYPNMLENLSKLDNVVDYFYLVDSYGSVMPNEVESMIRFVKCRTKVKIGFHGHNNIEMALANTMTAIKEGVDIIDATVTGMGRGAGNLKTELLLTVLSPKIKVDFNILSTITSEFELLQKKYNWGTSLPYMVSGSNSLPQKQVMDWVSKKSYSFNSIVRALNNQKNNTVEKEKYQLLKVDKKYKSALIIGGGSTVDDHNDALITFLNDNVNDMCVIHSSSKNARFFTNIKNDQYFCLIGNEGSRLENVLSKSHESITKCVLPPSPRIMGTYVPDFTIDKTFELNLINFTKIKENSHTTIALQLSIELGCKNIYLCGYDGYDGDQIAQKDQELFIQNTKLFDDFNKNYRRIVSLTPSLYKNLFSNSVYQLII